jgi:mono/diheme cytochrome c family protein
LFHDAKKGNCASCHGDLGLGDGPSAWKKDEKTGKTIPAYTDDWGFDILPRNLRQGLFRGGRRPIDIYRRIYAGINGGPMPGIGEAKDADGKPVMSDEDMWALVHYVRSLSERDEHVYGHEEVQTAQAGHGGSAPGAHSSVASELESSAATHGGSAPADGHGTGH